MLLAGTLPGLYSLHDLTSVWESTVKLKHNVNVGKSSRYYTADLGGGGA